MLEPVKPSRNPIVKIYGSLSRLRVYISEVGEAQDKLIKRTADVLANQADLYQRITDVGNVLNEAKLQLKLLAGAIRAAGYTGGGTSVKKEAS